MREVHHRLGVVEALINNETGLQARFAREASYLQLRMICETIALGCIIAHEGFSDVSARKLHKSYAADQIINELFKLHDRFYPQPIALKSHSTNRFAVSDRHIDHLSKDAMIQVYRKCGSVLHRGTPDAIRVGEKIEKDWVRYIDMTTQRAVNLLSHHALIMQGDERAIFCELSTGRVWAASAI